MKLQWALPLAIALFACADPAPQHSSAQTASGVSPNAIGGVLFEQTLTLAAGCSDEKYSFAPASGSSSAVVSWDRDTVPDEVANYLRPSMDVSNGAYYLVLCNLSSKTITLPAGARVSYEILNIEQ